MRREGGLQSYLYQMKRLKETEGKDYQPIDLHKLIAVIESFVRLLCAFEDPGNVTAKNAQFSLSPHR